MHRWLRGWQGCCLSGNSYIAPRQAVKFAGTGVLQPPTQCLPETSCCALTLAAALQVLLQAQMATG